MYVTGLTEFGLHNVVDKLSGMYGGNIILKGDITRKSKTRFSLGLRADSSFAKGARRSPYSDRRGPWACWHVFRDFSRLVFEMNSDARISTVMARYTSENFEDTYPDTDYYSAGMRDGYWSDLCDCGGNHGE